MGNALHLTYRLLRLMFGLEVILGATAVAALYALVWVWVDLRRGSTNLGWSSVNLASLAFWVGRRRGSLGRLLGRALWRLSSRFEIARCHYVPENESLARTEGRPALYRLVAECRLRAILRLARSKRVPADLTKVAEALLRVLEHR
jgi:hypothetical protein